MPAAQRRTEEDIPRRKLNRHTDERGGRIHEPKIMARKFRLADQSAGHQTAPDLGDRFIFVSRSTTHVVRLANANSPPTRRQPGAANKVWTTPLPTAPLPNEAQGTSVADAETLVALLGPLAI